MESWILTYLCVLGTFVFLYHVGLDQCNFTCSVRRRLRTAIGVEFHVALECNCLEAEMTLSPKDCQEQMFMSLNCLKNISGDLLGSHSLSFYS